MWWHRASALSDKRHLKDGFETVCDLFFIPILFI
jgi:hypothetical protein